MVIQSIINDHMLKRIAELYSMLCRPIPSKMVESERSDGIMMGGYDMMYGYGWIYMVLGTLLIVGIVLLIVWLVRQSSAGSAGSSDREETAMDILKKRYAKGEIDKNEFERMKRELT